MDIKQAVNRIYWRFGGNGNQKPFPVNEQDIESYNVLKNYVQETQQQQYEQSELFAKLYTYLFMKILENDKSTVMDNLARKKIYSLLKKPLFQIVEDFQQSLNDSEQYELLEAVSDLKHPCLKEDEEKEKDMRNLKECLKSPENVLKLTGKVWDYETVKDLVEAEVNQAINNFK